MFTQLPFTALKHVHDCNASFPAFASCLSVTLLKLHVAWHFAVKILDCADLHYDTLCGVRWFAASRKNRLRPSPTLKMEEAGSSETVVAQKIT
jgi:hypothetical protein